MVQAVWHGTITPISTWTNKPGPFIPAGRYPNGLAISCHSGQHADMNLPLAAVAHQAGTCRFGTDPATSVLDVNCKAHELDNLYVVDTSFFPSIGAVTPA